MLQSDEGAFYVEGKKIICRFLFEIKRKEKKCFTARLPIMYNIKNIETVRIIMERQNENAE
jgi:hypothetical protein